tara:strand:- start:19 stop:561 length:543 start_codon:yes stop_codon:yes gene_type:complete
VYKLVLHRGYDRATVALGGMSNDEKRALRVDKVLADFLLAGPPEGAIFRRLPLQKQLTVLEKLRSRVNPKIHEYELLGWFDKLKDDNSKKALKPVFDLYRTAVHNMEETLNGPGEIGFIDDPFDAGAVEHDLLAQIEPKNDFFEDPIPANLYVIDHGTGVSHHVFPEDDYEGLGRYNNSD